MFRDCKSFNQPINNWDVSNVKNNNWWQMFNGCQIKEEYKPKFNII
jgi:surface protein